MIALAIILGVLLLIALMPVGVRAVFDGSLSVYLTLSGIRVRIYPGKEKPKKAKKKNAKPQTDTTKKKKKIPKVTTLQDHLRLLTQLLGKLRRKILLKELTCHVIFGGDDPALNYGRAWAAIGGVMPILEQLFRIRKRDVGAYCSEDEPGLRFYIRAHAVLTTASIVHIALHALRGYLKIHKNNKPEKAVQ